MERCALRAWLARAGMPEWPRLDFGKIEISGDAFRLMYPAHPGSKAYTRCVTARRDRASPASDRPRRPQPSQPVSVWHRHRPQRARQEPDTTPMRHALVHEISAKTVSRSMMIGEPRRSASPRPSRRRGPDRGLSLGRHLPCAGAPLRPNRRHRHQALETRPPETPADEGAAARNHLRDGRALTGQGPQPTPADRQRDNRGTSESIPGSGNGATRRCSWQCSIGHIQRFGWPLQISTHPNKRTLYNYPMQCGGAEMLRWRRGDYATPVWCRACWCTTAFCLSSQPGAGPPRHRNHAAAGTDVCNGFEIGVDIEATGETAPATATNAKWRGRCGRPSWTCWRRSAPPKERKPRCDDGRQEPEVRGRQILAANPGRDGAHGADGGDAGGAA